MDPSSESEKLNLLPKPVKSIELIPLPCSIGQYYPNIILRNDGFNADAVYTLESFYSHFANILGNMERMEVDGVVLSEESTKTGKKINVSLLYDAGVLLTTSFSDSSSGGGINIRRDPGVPPGILHQKPELWSYEGKLPDGTEIVFKPVFEIPINYVADTTDKEGKQAPSIVIAYGKKNIVDYAFKNFMNPPFGPNKKTVSDDNAAEAVMLVTKEVSSKIAKAKGLE